jgi:hypothetical protein
MIVHSISPTTYPQLSLKTLNNLQKKMNSKVRFPTNASIFPYGVQFPSLIINGSILTISARIDSTDTILSRLASMKPITSLGSKAYTLYDAYINYHPVRVSALEANIATHQDTLEHSHMHHPTDPPHLGTRQVSRLHPDQRTLAHSVPKSSCRW